MKYLTLRVTCLPGLRIYYNICVVLTGWRAVANLWWWSTASLSPSTFPYSITLPHPITLPNPITLHYTTTRSPSTLSSSPSTQESQSSSPPCSPFSTPSPPLGRSTSYHRRSRFPYRRWSRFPYRRRSLSLNDCRQSQDTAQLQMISLKSVSCLIPCYVRAAFDIVHQPECSSFR